MSEPLPQNALDPIAIHGTPKDALRDNQSQSGVSRAITADQYRNAITAQQPATPQDSHKIAGAQAVPLMKS